MSSAARRRSPLRKAGAIATTLAAIATFLLAGVVLLPGLLGLERYVITGGSMSGTFERGAVVLAQVVPVDELAVGDIITYMPPADSGISELVTHRIESITASATGPVFITHGDANSSADTWSFQLSVLIENSIAHGAGPIRVVPADAGTHLSLTVSDDGARPVRTNIFTRRVTQGSGEGIGLAVASELAEAIGGHLVLGAEERTTFNLMLPKRELSGVSHGR